MKNAKWLIMVLFLAGCSTSRITSSWKDDTTTPRKYDKVLVVGLIGEPDRTMKEKMEQHMVGDLKELGYNAVGSVQEYGPKAFENIKEEEVLKLLYNRGIDAVITIVMLDKVKERYYEPAWVRNNRFWGYYSSMYDRVYTPGYYSATDTKYFWESNFYDMNDWRLLYSAQSQSFEPGSANSLAHEYGLMIIKDMTKNKIVQKQEQKFKPF
jgi:hypothetical protein